MPKGWHNLYKLKYLNFSGRQRQPALCLLWSQHVPAGQGHTTSDVLRAVEQRTVFAKCSQLLQNFTSKGSKRWLACAGPKMPVHPTESLTGETKSQCAVTQLRVLAYCSLFLTVQKRISSESVRQVRAQCRKII